MDEIVVTGKHSDLFGIASSASEGTASGVELRARPLARRGEALETVSRNGGDPTRGWRLDRKDRDIEYFYSSQLRNESAPVDDIHFHPAEPRMFRARVTYKF
jgi:hypothetical protein